ncbi:MAG: diguanylate cyclase [Candidatus Thermoplasmatota archaeon]|nr:diguanylate cyclase [Candidatus Thermoplasmatota archaeon]
MKIAVCETEGRVEGPGEAANIRIYETTPSLDMIEEYANPALKATAARGVWMLRSALDRGASAIIVAEAGAPAFSFLKGKAELFLGNGMEVESALEGFLDGTLPRLDKPTHEGHNHHNIRE